MSFKKSVRNSIFFVVMAITAVLLCVVGVHAVNMNLHFTANVSPDILCKIDCQNDTGNATIYDYSVQSDRTVGNLLSVNPVTSGVSSNLTFTLYNHTTNKNIRLSVENVTINGNPVQSYTYQPAVASFATSQSSPTHSTMILSVNASASEATITVHLKVEEVFSINLSGTGLATADTYYFAPADTITMPLTASVGYQLPQSMTSLDNTKYTTTYTHTKNTSGSVTITKSNSASELVLTNNLSLTCNCEQVFAIKENKATSMFANGNTAVLSASENYLPNNGDYSYLTETLTTTTLKVITEKTRQGVVTVDQDDTTYSLQTILQTTTTYVKEVLTDNEENILSTTFKEIIETNDNGNITTTTNTLGGENDIPASTANINASYHNIGEVTQATYNEIFANSQENPPQIETKVTTTPNSSNSTTTITNPMTAKKGSGFKEYKYYVEMGEYPQSEVPEPSNVTYKNEVSYSINGNTLIASYYTQSTTNEKFVKTRYYNNGVLSGENEYKWFKVEPIIWLVLDRDDGGNLDSLTFNNGMFYTDKLCGKAYTHGLLLMSAYTLDGQYFGNTSLTDFSNSQVSLFLNSNQFAQSTAIKNSQPNNQFSHLKGNYAKAIDELTTTIQTTEADEGEFAYYDNADLSSHFFLLAGNDADETFYFEKYYKNGIPAGENKGNLTYSVAVTAPTDFAKAHYAETNQITTSTGTTYTASANQGWVVNNGTLNVIDEKQGETSVYWSRSYGLASQTAMVSNFNGAMVSVSTKNSNIGVRPCFVLDLKHYNTEVFYGS